MEDVKRNELTSRQAEIYEYIKKYSKENRMPPTVREIGNHFEISSTNGVRSILAALIKKGYINRSPRLSRGIEVVDSGNNESSEAPTNTIEIPIVGRVAAGTHAVRKGLPVGGVTDEVRGVGGAGAVPAQGCRGGHRQAQCQQISKYIFSHKANSVVIVEKVDLNCKIKENMGNLYSFP